MLNLIEQLLDHFVELPLIAPILSNFIRNLVLRHIEPVLNVVKLNDSGTEDTNSPKFATPVSPRMLHPLVRKNSHKLPDQSNAGPHPRFSFVYLIQNLPFRDGDHLKSSCFCTTSL